MLAETAIFQEQYAVYLIHRVSFLGLFTALSTSLEKELLVLILQ